MDFTDLISNIVDFSPYIICFFISTSISFIDILDDYSIFKIKRGLGYKILFSLLNGVMSLILLCLLWNKVSTDITPIFKGFFVGLFYPTIMKSKFLLHDKKEPSESISLDKLYNKIMKIFHELIDDCERRFTTKTKKEIASKYDVNTLYNLAKDAIEDDPWLERVENKVTKKERLDGIENIKNDTSPDMIKREALAKFMINNYPKDIDKLRKK